MLNTANGNAVTTVRRTRWICSCRMQTSGSRRCSPRSGCFHGADAAARFWFFAVLMVFTAASGWRAAFHSHNLLQVNHASLDRFGL